MSLLKHKWFVFWAGHLINKTVEGFKISYVTLLVHDWSKFTPFQFSAYALQFQGGGCERFQEAWEQHYRIESHHPESWSYLVNSHGHVEYAMPEVSIREMIIDWMASDRDHHGFWCRENWYEQNLKETFHPKTRERVIQLLQQIGDKNGSRR